MGLFRLIPLPPHRGRFGRPGKDEQRLKSQTQLRLEKEEREKRVELGLPALEPEWKPWPLEQRYIWVNWERGIISVGDDKRAFERAVLPYERFVQKLKFKWDRIFLGGQRFANLDELSYYSGGG